MSIYPFPGPQRLTATSWPQRLRVANTEQGVVDAARDFLATFSPYDLARLPESLRPGRIVDANDVSELAFTLVRQCHDDAQGTARCIHKLTSFFTQASVRLSELKAQGAHAQLSRRGDDGPSQRAV